MNKMAKVYLISNYFKEIKGYNEKIQGRKKENFLQRVNVSGKATFLWGKIGGLSSRFTSLVLTK